MVAELASILAQTGTGLGVGVERSEVLWLGLGTIFMLLGTFYFLVRGWGVTGKQREYYGITIMITAIASASYLSMFFGFGLTQVPVEGLAEPLDIYWARYADWLFTTPLLLLDLALLADADRSSIVNLVLVDAFMIITGLVGALTKTYAFRFVWWTMSTIALAFLLYFLYVTLTEKAQRLDEDTQTTFVRLRNLTVVLWSLYPAVWLVGTEGFGVTGLFAETAAFMVLDVLAKVGFGFLLLSSRAVVDSGEEAPEPSAEVSPSSGD